MRSHFTILGLHLDRDAFDSDLPVDMQIKPGQQVVNFNCLRLFAKSPQTDWSCWPCSRSVPLPTLLCKTEASIFVLLNQIILCFLLLGLLGCLGVHCFLLLLPFFHFKSFCIKPIDDHRHIFGVSVHRVVQINKFLLLNVQQSVALSINLYLEELRRFSLCKQLFCLLLLFFLSQG